MLILVAHKWTRQFQTVSKLSRFIIILSGFNYFPCRIYYIFFLLISRNNLSLTNSFVWRKRKTEQKLGHFEIQLQHLSKPRINCIVLNWPFVLALSWQLSLTNPVHTFYLYPHRSPYPARSVLSSSLVQWKATK